MEIRKIKSHIKTEAVIPYIPELNFRIPLMIKNFQVYYDERKVLKEILKDNMFNKAKSFLNFIFSFEKYNNKISLLGGAIYSNSNGLNDLTLKKDLIPVFKIKKPLHIKKFILFLVFNITLFKIRLFFIFFSNILRFY